MQKGKGQEEIEKIISFLYFQKYIFIFYQKYIFAFHQKYITPVLPLSGSARSGRCCLQNAAKQELTLISVDCPISAQVIKNQYIYNQAVNCEL